MTAQDILELINALPQYIVYLYPGYITIYVYLFLEAKTMQDSKGILLKSICISFLYKIGLDNIADHFCYFLDDSKIQYHIFMILICCIVTFMFWKIQHIKAVQNLLKRIGIDTKFEGNGIDILDDGSQAAWLKVYLKSGNAVYEGFLGERELEEERHKFIILKKFRKYILDQNGYPKTPYIAENNDDDDKVLIFYEEIERIEKQKISEVLEEDIGNGESGEKAVMRYLKGKWKYIISIIFIMVLIPILTAFVIPGDQICVSTTNGEWIGFFGSYFGSILGGLITLFVMYKTLKTEHERDTRAEKQKFCFEIADDVSSLIALHKKARSYSLNPVDCGKYINACSDFWQKHSFIKIKLEYIKNDSEYEGVSDMLDAIENYSKAVEDMNEYYQKKTPMSLFINNPEALKANDKNLTDATIKFVKDNL